MAILWITTVSTVRMTYKEAIVTYCEGLSRRLPREMEGEGGGWSDECLGQDSRSQGWDLNDRRTSSSITYVECDPMLLGTSEHVPYVDSMINVTEYCVKKQTKQTPWSESASELHRPSDRRLSAKWLPTRADRRCHVVSATDPSGRILGFLDRSRYFSIK
jgi:hypothetical protein